MRCRKARSLLSAACFEELSARRQATLREHVASCPSCKREYAVYESLHSATRDLPNLPVSDDFNTRLLNRIAQERFAETRNRAYLPKAAPSFRWARLVPITVAAGLLAVIALNVYQPIGPAVSSEPGAVASIPVTIDDSYLTAQPSDNPNMTLAMGEGWTLDERLARSERLDQISQRLTSHRAFLNQLTGTGGSQYRTALPPAGQFFQVPGVSYRIYRVTAPTGGGGAQRAY